MPCHALLCRAVPSRAVPCRAWPGLAKNLINKSLPCHAMPHPARPCRARPCHAWPRPAQPSLARPGRAMPDHAKPRLATISLFDRIFPHPETTEESVTCGAEIADADAIAGVRENVNDQFGIINDLRVVFDRERALPFVKSRTAAHDALTL